MSGRVQYVPDRVGMASLALSSKMSGAMVEAAEVGRRFAESKAPRESGRYAASFVVVPVTVRAGHANEPRAGAMLANTAPYAASLEWGDGYHLLGQAAFIIDGRRHKGAEAAMLGPTRRNALRKKRRRASEGPG